ncbi:coiled-coil domain-containing protein 175-like isoform X2 [Rhineura floridana]|nr:coiled-coil domain-containing protein 175-like isoform X2 [Rhineura floridana]
MKEFKELVAAAHRYRFHKLSDIETSINEITTAVESTYSKQTVSEEQNLSLCKEEGELWVKHEEEVELLNEQLAAKHKVNIEINELHNMKKHEEEEIVWQESIIREVKYIMATEAADFRAKKDLLDMQIADVRKRLEAKKPEVEDKREEYEALHNMLRDLQKQIAEYNQIISARRNELGELFKKIKQLIHDYEEKKAEKENILRKKADLKTKLSTMDTSFDEEKDRLLRQITEADEKLAVVMRYYEKLRNENDLLDTQFRLLTDEEDQYCSQRDQLAEEFEKLSNLLTEKLDSVAKRLVETKGIEEEVERLQEIYDSSQHTYARELATLEVSLTKEGDRRTALQNQLNEMTAEYQKILTDHDELVNSSMQKTEAGKKQLADFTDQNEHLKTEIENSKETVKLLTSKLKKKEAYYKKCDAGMEAGLKKLEEEYKAITKLTEEKQEQLRVNLPIAEEMETEFEGINTDYTNRKDLHTELLEEQRMLTKSIERSTIEVTKLKRQKTRMRSEIKTSREVALSQLKTFAYSLKFLERDNYEINRKLYILNIENERLRAGIAYLREDISAMDSEAKLYQSKRQKTQKETRDLHDLFVKKWIKDDNLQKMYLRHQHDILTILGEYIKKNMKRNDKLDYVHGGLQLNYEAMESLLRSKSTAADDKK